MISMFVFTLQTMPNHMNPNKPILVVNNQQKLQIYKITTQHEFGGCRKIFSERLKEGGLV